jgi:putative oxidoreductase
MKKHITVPAKIIRPILFALDNLRSLGDLSVRFWIANIFIQSGLSKITSWTTTLVLFKYEYTVPFISAASAAYIGTAFEFIFPILLILGFGGRLLIFCFFIYNLICVVSFQFLWTPAGSSGLNDHINWSLLLMMLMLHGSGKFSIDYLLHRKFGFLFKLGKKGQYQWANYKKN